MKNLIAIIFLGLMAKGCFAQQQFTQTASDANLRSFRTVIDNPDLNGNTNAVIFVTPIEVKGVNLNPHPMYIYWDYDKKWSIENADGNNIQKGSQFKVEYYTQPDDNHFVHIVTQKNLTDNGSYIDHAGLNGNPDAKIQFFQNCAPAIHGGVANPNDIQIQYDNTAGKWLLSNINGKRLGYSTAYNISFSSNSNPSTGSASTQSAPASSSNNPPVTTTSNTNIPCIDINNPVKHILMKVTGQKQGQFICESPGYKFNNNCIEATDYEMGVSVSTDPATGLPKANRTYAPITILKNSGPASLQFFSALTTNENLTTVIIQVYKSSSTSSAVVKDEMDYTIKLTNAHVIDYKQSFTDGQKLIKDIIKLNFEKIELNYPVVGIQASDDWGTHQ